MPRYHARTAPVAETTLDRYLAPFRRFGRPMALGVSLGVLMAFGAPMTANAGPLEDASQVFKPYAVEQISTALSGAQQMQQKVAAGDVAGAQKAWIAARVGWESAEVFTGQFFPELDDAIDQWPDAKKGFHAIEARLFAGNLDGVKPAVDELVANLTTFDQKLRDPAFKFTPQGLLNGTAGLAYEIGENKANGGESPFSNNSLADIRYNVAGVHVAYDTVFEAALKQADPKLAKKADDEIHALVALLKQAKSLKEIDQEKLRRTSENLAADLQVAGPKLGLEKPTLGE